MTTQYIYDLTDTWNAAGTVFTAIKMDVTDTASAAGSRLFDLQKGGVTQFNVDKNGNVGLGVAPGNWITTWKAIRIGGSGALSSRTDVFGTLLAQNSFISDSGDNTYIGNAAATQYFQTGGQHQWYTAASGTAGAAISFTQAMTLDGAGSLGIGTTSPSAKLHVYGNNPGAYLYSRIENISSTGYSSQDFLVGPGGANGIASVNYAPGIFFAIGPTTNDTTTPIVLRNNNGTERMRIDASGSLLINTTTPSSLLASGRGLVELNGSSDTVFAFKVADTLNSYLYSSASEFRVASHTSIPIVFFTGASEKMRLDSAGTLGLGVTPNAWDTVTPIQIKNGSLYGYSTTEVVVMQNAYYQGGFKYITTGNLATRYDQVSGAHAWYIAPSGTAGAAITFTQAMTLDTSGRLGIGVTSPTSRLTIGSGTLTAAAANTSGLYTDASLGLVVLTDGLFVGARGGATRLVLNTSGNLGLGVTPSAWQWVAFQTQRSSMSGGVNDRTELSYNYFRTSGTNTYIGSDYASQYVQIGGQHRWNIAPSGTAGNAISFTQAMTLDAGGNLGIGTTSPVAGLDVNSSTASIRAAVTNGTFFLREFGGSAANNTIELSIRSGSGKSGYLTFTEDAVADRWSVGIANGEGSLRFLSGTPTAGTERMRLDANGNVVINTAAIATTATDGFLYVPSCAGTPTGTPTAYTGRVPIVVDTTNNKLYFYSGGQWRDAGP